ncbi:MAG: Gfo/Idh/MocA family protein [bacterium]
MEKEQKKLPLKVGVIGVGHLGQHHARLYHELEGCQLAGIADLDEQRLDNLAKLYQTKAYGNYEELLPFVDAVSIAVPTSLHYKVAKFFLFAGKDCLLEKPITSTMEQGKELVKLAKEKNLIFQIGHLERFNPAILALEERINKPMFIESHRLAPFVERGTDVDVVLDLMIHDIDIILSLVQSKVVKINAVGVPIITNTTDIANARLEFASGCVANVTSSRVSMKKERKIRIFQRDSYFSIDYANSKINYCLLKQKDPLERGSFPKEIIHREILCQKEEPLKSQLVSFLYAVRNRTRPKVSGEDGLEALGIAQKIKDVIFAHSPYS